ncbi:MAG: hypothetical protein WBF75_00315, partial [Pseudonocardiaceae bacterium]
ESDTSCHFRHPNSDHDRSAALTWATTSCGRDVVRRRLRRRLVRQRSVGEVMGLRATRAGGAQAGATGRWCLPSSERRID